jgi:hypothetical protein
MPWSVTRSPPGCLTTTASHGTFMSAIPTAASRRSWALRPFSASPSSCRNSGRTAWAGAQRQGATGPSSIPRPTAPAATALLAVLPGPTWPRTGRGPGAAAAPPPRRERLRPPGGLQCPSAVMRPDLLSWQSRARPLTRRLLGRHTLPAVSVRKIVSPGLSEGAGGPLERTRAPTGPPGSPESGPRPGRARAGHGTPLRRGRVSPAPPPCRTSTPGYPPPRRNRSSSTPSR